MAQQTALSVMAYPGMVHSFVSKEAVDLTGVVTKRFGITGLQSSNFSAIGTDDKNFSLIGTDDNNFSISGA